LDVFQSLAAKGSKNRAQEFCALAKATRLEISLLQKNQTRSGRCERDRDSVLWQPSMMAVSFGFGSAPTMNMSGYCASFELSNHLLPGPFVLPH
jgi:hypothetical protein